MKLSKKRTCNGCKSHSDNGLVCDLMFKTKAKLNRLWFTEYAPSEPCYKPKTLKEWLEAHQLKFK